MPPKTSKKADAKGGKAAPAKKKDAPAGGSGKAKKKKWSKGKVRDKLQNMVLFDQATFDKLYKVCFLVFYKNFCAYFVIPLWFRA